MLNNYVVSFYHNFGLIFKCLENMATNGIEKWSFSTPPWLIDASSRENHSEYPQFRINLTPPKTTVTGKHLCRRRYGSIFIRFYIVASKREAEKSSKTNDKNRF